MTRDAPESGTLGDARRLAERVEATVKVSQGTYPYLVERVWYDAHGRRRHVGFYARSLVGVFALLLNKNGLLYPDRRSA